MMTKSEYQSRISNNGPESIANTIFFITTYSISMLVKIITTTFFWNLVPIAFNLYIFSFQYYCGLREVTFGLCPIHHFMFTFTFSYLQHVAFIMVFSVLLTLHFHEVNYITGLTLLMFIVLAMSYFSAMPHIILMSYILKMPITLTNSVMHSLNGNIIERTQKVAPEYVEPQGFDVNHKFQWKTGDRLVSGVMDYFQFNKKSSDLESLSESFKTCEEQKVDILTYFTSERTMMVATIASIILYLVRPNTVTRHLLIVMLGVMMFTKLSQTKLKEVSILDMQEVFTYVSEDTPKDDTEITAQGFDVDTSTIAKFLLILITVVTGYKVKNAFIPALILATKITDTQTSNVALALAFAVGKIHEFLVSMSFDEAAKYFHINHITDIEVKHFQERTYAFVASFNSGNPESMIYCADVYHSLLAEGKVLDKKVEKNSYDAKMLADCLTKLLSVYVKICDAKVSTNGDRVEPVGVLFRGAPGTLKSLVAQRFASVVMMATLPEEWKKAYRQDPREFTFPVPKDSFWDGYTNKAWITTIDDVFQRRDAVADSDSDALKIIDMINTVAHQPKMAAVQQKNSVYFRSAYVIGTSNITDWSQLQSPTDFEAVRRRFVLEVEVKINKKYATPDGKVDKSKLPVDPEVDSTTVPNDFWWLNLVEKHGATYKRSRPVTLKELIKIGVERHSIHKKNFFINKKASEKLVKELSEDLGYAWSAEEELFPQSFNPQKFNPKFDISISSYIQTLSALERENLDDKYWMLCDSLGRMDLYCDGFKDVIDHYYDSSWPVKDGRHLVESSDLLLMEIKNYYRESISRGINPLTKNPEDYLEKPNKSMPTIMLTQMMGEFLAFCEENWMYLLAGAALSTAIVYLADFILTCFKADAQSVDLRKMGSRHGPKKVVKLKALDGAGPKYELQGRLPPDFGFDGLPKFTALDFGTRGNKNDVLAKIFNKYYYIVYIVEAGNTDFEATRFGHAINVTGQLFLMPFHFAFLAKHVIEKKGYKGATIILVTPCNNNRYTLSAEEFVNSIRTNQDSADKDICIAKIECAQRMSKGALDSIINLKDLTALQRTTSFNASVLGSYQCKKIKGLSMRNHHVHASINKGAIQVSMTWSDDNLAYKMFDTYMYDIDSGEGDCGSMLVCSDGNFENRLICGIHIAGGHKHGFSTGICRESVDKLIEDTFGFTPTLEDEEVTIGTLADPIECQGSLAPMIILKKEFVPSEVFKSEIRKSRLHKKLPAPYNKVETMPAKLRSWINEDGELIDPTEIAFNKYGKVSPDIDIVMVDAAFESFENLILRHDTTAPEAKRVYTVKEALHAIDNINTISSSTSSGFPMSLPGQDDLKKMYYKALEEGDHELAESVYQRIALLVEETIAKYKDGIRSLSVYKQCGKDETIAAVKVLMGKIRLFAACPFIFLVMFRMYFGAYMSMFIGLNLKIGSAVGVNPYSEDWDAIARRLLQFSKSENEESVGAGDQGEFDTRQWAVIQSRGGDSVNRWYGEEKQIDNFIRDCLFLEITNSRHLYRGIIYQWFSGLPSGNPMTAILNTMYNHIVFRISWQIAGLPIVEFNDSVYLIVLGDDNQFSVLEKYREVFNEITLTEYMAKVGMKYTTELKGEAVKPFRKLTDTEFLKRTYRKDERLNRWVAPLRESAIAEMLNWTKKGKDGDQITLDNMVFAMREFSLHGKEKFDYWRDKLVHLKQTLFPRMNPHGDFPLHFGNTYAKVLKLEYIF